MPANAPAPAPLVEGDIKPAPLVEGDIKPAPLVEGDIKPAPLRAASDVGREVPAAARTRNAAGRYTRA